jgi:1,4-alpha-glucan branching enzyme
VFAYCRTAGMALGSSGQVIVIANMGPQSYSTYGIPDWPWNGTALTEVGYAASPPSWDSASGTLSLTLNSFAARVFRV